MRTAYSGPDGGLETTGSAPFSPTLSDAIERIARRRRARGEIGHLEYVSLLSSIRE
jgi:hypothetical protein